MQTRCQLLRMFFCLFVSMWLIKIGKFSRFLLCVIHERKTRNKKLYFLSFFCSSNSSRQWKFSQLNKTQNRKRILALGKKQQENKHKARERIVNFYGNKTILILCAEGKEKQNSLIPLVLLPLALRWAKEASERGKNTAGGSEFFVISAHLHLRDWKTERKREKQSAFAPNNKCALFSLQPCVLSRQLNS